MENLVGSFLPQYKYSSTENMPCALWGHHLSQANALQSVRAQICNITDGE